jgi:CHAD domain-containing protein
MTYRLDPLCPTGESVQEIAAAQIGDVIAKFGGEPLSVIAIHETRKALKRLRALLGLVRGGLPSDDLRREKQRLRAIAHSLAGARDAHVMIATAAALENEAMPRACRPASRLLMKLLRQREQAEAPSLGQARLPVAALREAQAGLRALPMDGLTFSEVLDGFTQSYRLGRRLAGEVFQADAEDECFHDLRKQVQQHWRHLQLVSNAWPKGLRPQIMLARELSETLGKDHDIALLAGLAREQESREPGKRFDAYGEFCAGQQEKLRRHAELLARRLYAEKPKAVRRRIRSYWETAAQAGRQAERTQHAAAKADTPPVQAMLSSA